MLRPALSTAKSRLKVRWKSVALTVLVGGAALALLFAAQSFTAPGEGLQLDPIPATGTVLAWTSEMREAASFRAEALRDLLLLLVGLGYVTLLVTIVTAGSRSAAEAAARRAELSVRRAVGASRMTLLGALLIETGVILVAIVAAGLALGSIGTRIGGSLWPGVLGNLRFAPSWNPLLVVVGLTVLVVLVVGATSRVRMTESDEAPVPLTVPAAQLGFCLAILVAGSMVLDRSKELTMTPTGADQSGTVISLRLSETTREQRSRRYQSMLDELAGDDSITTASLTSPGAVLGMGPVDLVTTDCGMCPSATIILQYHSFPAVHEFVSADTFKAQRIPVTEGRGITPDDTWSSPRVAVVNRHLALRHYEHGDAIGRDIFIASGWPATPYKVVGIVEDEPSPVLGAALEPRPTVYLSVLQHPPVNAELLIEGGRQLPALEGMATDTAISQRALARREANPLRWFAAWFRLGGLVMLAIALLGTFTTLRMWVRSRAAELGLRRSVGATKLSVAMFVLRHAVAMAAGGLAIGLFLFAVIARPSIADLFADLRAWNGNVDLSLGVLLVGTAIASALLATWTLLQRPPSAILATSE
jgi:hypothetical protein